MKKGAHFDIEKTRRFVLWRIWDDSKPCINFIGLNPSTADHENDDPTIRRLIGFARQWGFGGFKMFNLYSYISTDPSRLVSDKYPNEFKDDLSWFIRHNYVDGPIVFCWGNFKEAWRRAQYYIEHYPNAMCFGKNKNGTPKHPLYLSKMTELQKFNK